MSHILEIKSAELSYDSGTTKVLVEASAHLERGKLTALIGRNGAGKSSLLNAILGQLTLSKERFF